MKKLLVVGSCSVHLFNFIDLVQDYFDEILFITDTNCKEVNMNIKTNVNVIYLSFSFKNIFAIFKIRKIINDFKPTHIHVHQANSYAFYTFLACWNCKAKKILNVWGSDILVNPKKSFFLKYIVKFILSKADFVVGDSNLVLRESKKLFPDIKTMNINFGVDIKSCVEKKENIIYSNRLHKKNYNIDKIIISFSKFVKKFPDWKLIIAGEGEETINLKKLVKNLDIDDKVEFIGFVDKFTNTYYYCKAKIYVSIPNSDSVSLSLVEAILSKCIVFVSDIDANREIVNNKLGFFEEDIYNIDFSKYKLLENIDKTEILDQIKKQYSKQYNKERLIKIYES